MIGTLGKGPTLGLGLDGRENESETSPFCGVHTGRPAMGEPQAEGPPSAPWPRSHAAAGPGSRRSARHRAPGAPHQPAFPCSERPPDPLRSRPPMLLHLNGLRPRLPGSPALLAGRRPPIRSYRNRLPCSRPAHTATVLLCHPITPLRRSSLSSSFCRPFPPYARARGGSGQRIYLGTATLAVIGRK